MYFMRRRTVMWIAIIAIVMLLSGGMLHAVVEHDHDGALWDGAHAALVHEQKYLFGVLFPMLVMFGALAAGAVCTGGRVRAATARMRPHQFETLLADGILSYRVFG